MKCVNPECQVPDCSSTKALVTNHTRQCRAGDACTYPRCALSKRLMRHHRECPDQACPICLPLRRRLAAAKMGAVAGQVPQHAQNRRKLPKRKKDDDDDYDAKRRRALQNGQQKAGRRLAPAQETVEIVPAAELDILESGFCVSVLFVNSRRGLAGIPAEGDWRPGTVMRAYTVPHEREIVYDVMMASGVEEKAVQHNRCRMVCSGCLCEKRAFRPPPMFCEKCYQAIHSRWSYWEESGEEGGIKLCKRCHADIRASHHPDRLLADLTQGRAGKFDLFIEKKEKDRPEFVDNWVQCDECHSWLHWTCALYKGEDTPEETLFFCEGCRQARGKELPKELFIPTSDTLKTDELALYLEKALHDELTSRRVTCEPVTIRVVSNIETKTKFSDQMERQSSMATKGATSGMGADKVKEFPYRSKCILAFQKVRLIRRLEQQGATPTSLSSHPHSSLSRCTAPRSASSRCTCRSTAPTAPSRTPTACTSRTSTRSATSSRRPRATAPPSTTPC